MAKAQAKPKADPQIATDESGTKIPTEDVERIALDTNRTKSSRIRELGSLGMTPSQIAAALGIRYQHAYNVLHRQLKRPAQPTTTHAS